LPFTSGRTWSIGVTGCCGREDPAGTPGQGSAGTDAEEAAEAKAPPLRILVVVDNRDAADGLCLLLRTWEFDVRVA
jgi:hypothetical protein